MITLGSNIGGDGKLRSSGVVCAFCGKVKNNHERLDN